ncbi:MAG: hypothetical protein RLZZ213_1643, partial [Cyanobacteriota bacterium]
ESAYGPTSLDHVINCEQQLEVDPTLD